MEDRKEALAQMEEQLECVRAYDRAKASSEIPIPFEQAIEEIERSRKEI
jgi:hypothetical protein